MFRLSIRSSSGEYKYLHVYNKWMLYIRSCVDGIQKSISLITKHDAFHYGLNKRTEMDEHVVRMYEMKTSNSYSILVANIDIVWDIKAHKGGKRLKLPLRLINWTPRQEDVSGVEIQPFLTSALDGGEWSASRLGRFNLAERAPGSQWLRECVSPRTGLHAVE
jgi:hypothetical protein